MSEIKVNSIVDASGGSTVQVNGYTPTMSNMAGRNRIINGNFDIWQRGTSSLSSGADRYVADRWEITPPSAVSTDVTREFNTTLQSYLMRVKVNATGVASFRQKIEGFKQFHNKDVTYSFKALGNLFSSVTVSVRLYHSGGNVILHSATHSLTGSLTDITGSLSVGDVSSYTEDASSTLRLLFSTDSSSTGAYIDIAQVQLEAGSVATPFEHRQYGQELALCQRYYYQAVPLNSYNTYTVVCTANSSTTGFAFFSFPVTMRAAPTLSATTGTNYYDLYIAAADRYTSSFTLSNPTTNQAQLVCTISGATAGQAGVLYIASSGAAIAFSAEL